MMQFNVAGLLKGPVGGSQRHQVDETSLALEDAQVKRLWGSITLVRINEGVWVKGNLQARVVCTCSRCLRPYDTTLPFLFNETYHPTVDVTTGVPVALPDGAEADTTIDTHHILDIEEVVRQDIILAIPMKPLCQSNCAGICPHCGKDLNETSCDCPQEMVDPRWATLLGLLSTTKK
ncbi:MAG: DUF177 domain-containing protein [Chloroflexi bacterium]|nr:DUF177 domain-containing protein [Chloroflexota bacterium]